jgi:hypothetical protein
MATVLLGLPSTLADWGPAVGYDDSFGSQTFPRSVLCSFSVASSSKITVGGQNKALKTTTSVAVRYITD